MESGDGGWQFHDRWYRYVTPVHTCHLFDRVIVTEPEPAAALLHHVLRDRLSIDPREHPLMLTEPAWNTAKARETLSEMVFEGEGVPAMYLGAAGVLSA